MDIHRMAARAALSALALASGAALAAGPDTNAGTDISNSATVDYVVGGVSQTAVTSNTVTFETDRKVNLVVAEVGGGYTVVSPGLTQQALRFQVTNLSNDVIDIRLTFVNSASGTAGPFGGIDNYSTTSNAVLLDDGDGVFEPGTDDGGVAFLNNMAEDETRTVWVSGSIPLGRANGDLAVGTLLAFGNSDGAGGAANDYVESATESAAVIDTVLADGAGPDDAARDGDFSARDGWQVQTATMGVAKTSTVITDPFNCTTAGDASTCSGVAKAVPGAVIEYCIVITNSGSAAADAVTISDALAATVTFVSGSLVAGGAADCTGGTAEDDNATDADDVLGAAENTGNLTGSTVSTQVFTLPNGAATSSRFRVTVN